MQCVYLGDNLPNSFEEQLFFSKEMPYRIHIKHFQSEDIVPLHYADSIEILLCDGLRGEIVINANRFPLGGKQLFIIPPYTIHANSIYPGNGVMYVFKISFHEMGQYLLLENYLKVCGCRLDQLLYQAPAYDEVFSIVQFLIRHDGDLKLCLPPILELFRILSSYTDPQRNTAIHSQFKGSSLQELITWTNRNYARKITIEEVAKMTGYSKYYFCSHFKALTGMTYMNYLNSVRISHACLMLSQGESVQTVCRNTGFENTSHFIQMFKRIQHVTPHQYACQQKKLIQEHKE
ncbi:MAG TPA: helix-turn-helix transcriptional regulator [Candidatus Faecousia intestinigallinarum]|nr:helix-turn-helix transcriptional regulator [Candidatus Faecousia intestinigallinarum]